MAHETEDARETDAARDRHAEAFDSLKRSEELYRTLVESSQALVWRSDTEGRYTFLNEAWEQTLGYRRDEMLGRTVRDFQSPDVSAYGVEAIARNMDGVLAAEYEITQVSKDGREVRLLFNATAMHDGDGRMIGTQGTAQDVTERRLADTYRDAAGEILQVLNEPGRLRKSIRRVLATLRSRTGVDAVGIRLQDGDDFPYFVQAGFANSFLKRENSLVERAADGGVCRNKDGGTSLECTCGLVISGAASPLLTPRGSFWTNDSLPLLDIPADEDPRRHPRNQCIHYGYASVALVPIRSKEKIVGLIQLNDRRKGRFTPERVEILEGVASQIGEALMRKKMEAALLESEQKLRENQERLQSMAFDAAVVQERERRRIAVDLHDSLGQALALAQIKLTTARDDAPDRARGAIDEVVALLRQAIIDSRSLVFALSPPVLYDLGLNAAISWLIDEVQKQHGMQVTLTDDGADKSPDETTAVVVFRAVRELLMNVLKHANRPEANVTLGRAGDYLEVVVEDAGVGFDPAKMISAPKGRSFGLFSLREQITRLGGTVEITSARGRGTRVQLRVPLDRRP